MSDPTPVIDVVAETVVPAAPVPPSLPELTPEQQLQLERNRAFYSSVGTQAVDNACQLLINVSAQAGTAYSSVYDMTDPQTGAASGQGFVFSLSAPPEVIAKVLDGIAWALNPDAVPDANKLIVPEAKSLIIP
jgi:hypothetical protein